MARVGVSLLLLNFLICTSESAIARPSNPTDFIKSSCRATRYPALCVQCLSGYASVIHQSKRQLAIASLSVSISKTRSCSSFFSHKLDQAIRTKNPRAHRAVQDCIENMADSLDRLSQSVRELGRTRRSAGQDFVWHISNVQTWVSAALTDQDTCLDGFSGSGSGSGSGSDEELKAAVRSRVLNVAQVTSNALALVNRFASRHRSL